MTAGSPFPAQTSPVRERRASPWRRRAGRALGVVVGLATAIALLLTAVLPTQMPALTSFAYNWVYSFCIGAFIQFLVELGRHGLARLLRIRSPADEELQHDWPGWRWFGPWLVIASLLGYLLGGLLADTLLGRRHIASMLSGELQPLVFMAVLTLLVSVMTSLVFIARSRADAAIARTQQVERQAAEHQLRLLESQLEPHMLFNTLANLRLLIADDPPQAQAMLDRLIAYLRGTLGGSLARTHPLETEFARLEDYLALMTIRMGDRLHCEFGLPQRLRLHPVPPLLLQPLVENAIRHGLEPAVAGGTVSVRAQAEGQELVLTVADTGVGIDASATEGAESAGARPGFGTRQVRQRLATLHGAAASLTLEAGPEGRGTLARIRLPLHPLESGPGGSKPQSRDE